MDNVSLLTKELLEKTVDLLKEDGRWCQKAFARDKSGNPCSIINTYATSFCLLGALEKCNDTSLGWGLEKLVIEKLHGVMLRKYGGGWGSISNWNDYEGRKQEEVVDLLETVIKDI